MSAEDRRPDRAGVLVDRSPGPGTFLGSPSLARVDDGWIASLDLFGPGTASRETRVLASTDGHRWRRIADIDGQFWSTLFAHGGALYLLGTSGAYGDLVIRRSTDGGRTWTQPADAASGLLRRGYFHTAPVPVVVHRGRIWRGVEVRPDPRDVPNPLSAMLASAAVDADLLDARNWEYTDAIPVPETLHAAGMERWLEGNAVVDVDGEVALVLRGDKWTGPGQSAAIVRFRGGRAVAAVEEIAMPGGGSKFTIRQDATGRFLALVNTPLFDAARTLGLRARNTLSLASSDDLRNWRVDEVLLHHPDDARHAFQYADWRFDGDAIAAVVRTARDLDGEPAASHHDSNAITFHRFRRPAGHQTMEA